ncbi:XrtA/PEP-CTERM system histidine kinase PrsK [Duganella callida]|uniref:histidine kinase n=1 Tax=Duganella callida TaxID=2561932 RepID=A0A4Y9S6V2_9BURK|nr:XrtA/PEP-CTERM system histidine kinase PrsK [Duganella callida]TFW17284.1 PEP-CTERM system histidine kinase PrsK [Duganella callida]
MLNNVAAVSYGIATLAFLLLCVLLLTSWRGRAHGLPLALACAATVLWSAASVWYAGTRAQPLLLALLETVRNGAWSAFLLMLLGHLKRERGLRPLPWLVGAVHALFLVILVLDTLGVPPFDAIGLLALVTTRVGLAVLGMLLVEQLYRNKPLHERWAIKFACLGIGGMFVFDFYLYSHALLFRGMDPEIWAARGLVNALTVPLIAVSAARSASWSSEIAVSRRVLFHSAALLGSAAYLLLMGSAGYYLRYFGGEWGMVMQVAFLSAATALLAGILFSGTVRAWLKVFISKHFYSYNYDYREEWLRFTRTLSMEGPNLGERSIQAVAELVESPGGALWIRRESGLCEPAAHWHIPPPSFSEPANSPFSLYLESKQWVIDLAEYADKPELYGNVEMPESLRHFARGRLIVPLILQGRLFGFVMLIQPRSRIVLNWEVIDLLKIAGSQAASYLAQQEAANALMFARQFESFNRMSTFVVHDLKNLVSQLSLLSLNAEKHRDNPEFQRDMVETVGYSVQKMKLLLQKLGRVPAAERPLPLAIDQVVQQAVALKAAFEPRPILDIAEPGLTVLADRERLERVLGHLIQNAIEATPKDGQVRIRLHAEADAVLVEISDTGQGMSEEFMRERLFKPFDSTKSAGMGIGAFESRQYIHELGGRLDVSSRPLAGTTFRVILPLHRQMMQTVDQAA